MGPEPEAGARGPAQGGDLHPSVPARHREQLDGKNVPDRRVGVRGLEGGRRRNEVEIHKVAVSKVRHAVASRDRRDGGKDRVQGDIEGKGGRYAPRQIVIVESITIDRRLDAPVHHVTFPDDRTQTDGHSPGGGRRGQVEHSGSQGQRLAGAGIVQLKAEEIGPSIGDIEVQGDGAAAGGGRKGPSLALDGRETRGFHLVEQLVLGGSQEGGVRLPRVPDRHIHGPWSRRSHRDGRGFGATGEES